MFKLFFFVHIFSIVTAFGPTFTFPMIANMNKKEPKMAVFGARIMDLIEYRYTIPFALLAGAAGVGMILTGHIHLFANTWLWIAIIIYISAVTFAVAFQGRNSKKMVELLEKMSQGGPPPEGAPPGPPPALAELAKKLQAGGIFLTLAVIAIMILMVFKPGAAPNLP